MFKVKPWAGNPEYWCVMDDWIFPNRWNPSISFNVDPLYKIRHIHDETNKTTVTNERCTRCKKEIPAIVKAAFLIEIMERKQPYEKTT